MPKSGKNRTSKRPHATSVVIVGERTFALGRQAWSTSPQSARAELSVRQRPLSVTVRVALGTDFVVWVVAQAGRQPLSPVCSYPDGTWTRHSCVRPLTRSILRTALLQNFNDRLRAAIRGTLVFLDHGRLRFNTEWPSQSPDSNPLEVFWGLLAREAHAPHVNSNEELVDALREALLRISRQRFGAVNALCASLPTRSTAAARSR
mmetsp:Transcript_43781/g.135200  ORF Transcript_43781/g.135200 Transcript_43781/m.135200 type:complete len:205 (-) Transcript_43781:190-804(-)